ncbi:MAG: UDP-N-acetylglucosamine 1-carboxyvinyltransferase [Desulfobulbaceae bacterium]|jgi:UDP-N-acetylglucosamine 1-carboxyvinyltransferase|nr:UDP-N-acetylglucosamine 1-carboxyvinyltransferase [Desulfobulbaceae bacterium]HKJ15457.1 UDP-N-acetylglucosamine 1-carboxyvinyltransferase [Desulfobulbales bacterium]MDH3541436.1 UDP-N-acetylglucosamine 1-carboxyvinyltransferase [Desulfobulbaceae bacterium]MDH3776458.1 UDP-N-acetylglucosamine 1-carboxyvinyltransferase [Desulfobulbaceae bacterium]MDH3781205.1 UDP-N-acetylglucosamine 1-carboxyvinyltransferase [Desulfobulbaceae bacterium]
MHKLIIEGAHKLQGEVRISGAKNAALPLIAATLLARGWHTIHNVPDLRDTRTMLALLETLGAQWKWENSTLLVNTDSLNNFEASYDLVKTMRASILVLGPLLARMGKTRVSLPGGCAIGARPIDFHLQGLKNMGATLALEDGYVTASAKKHLTGGNVYFDVPSVTGTENILMAAVLAKGETVIKNAAREPEVSNLVDMLISMGARISGKGTERLTIQGVKKLRPAEIITIPDRIETGTYLIAVGTAGGEASVTHCQPSHLPSLIEKLRSAGLIIKESENSLFVSRPAKVQSIDIKTQPYPGFPTDLQAQLMVLMTLANGLSVITETIFENRFMHVAELKRMGADIKINGHSAIVKGIKQLKGAPVMATDLRASASLVVAALAAHGITEISRIYHLERGYEDMVGKLQALGAKVRKEKE